MARLYIRRLRAASVAVSTRRQLDIGPGDFPSWREPTPKQRVALRDLHMGIPVDPSTRWTLIRDNFLKPGCGR